MKKQVRAVVLDWAGTMIDYGSLAPAKVFQKVFADAGVQISIAEAREPMGMAKREHIQAIMANADLAKRWQQATGAAANEADIDRLYENFLPLQSEVISQYCDLIPGAIETFHWCQDHDIRVASTTGYTRSIMDVVTRIAADKGYSPEVVLCADDAEFGRPAPWLIFECARRFNVYPMDSIVKVDDTVVGIEAGVNAGAWSVGVALSGNLMGRTEQELSDLEPAELLRLKNESTRVLKAAGAHFVIDSIADLPQVIGEINSRWCKQEPAEISA